MRRDASRRAIRGVALASAGLACALAAMLAPRRAAADPVRDTLPFRIVHGRPQFTSGDETAIYFWLHGGRFRLRITADEEPHRIRGELRTSQSGVFEDVTPLSENLRVRQPRPGKLIFDVRTADAEEGFDVTLTGDYTQITIDLLVDGERQPAIFRIGEKKRTPAALPARLDLRNADSSWLERFGF